MEGLRRAAVLLSLIEELQAQGSWGGETHVQKTAYFLQEMTRVPLDFRFILYKHGPFSFDLRADLAAMHAKSFISLRIQSLGYGPSLLPGPLADLLKKTYPVSSRRYLPQIRFLAACFGARRVTELERLATALFVTLEKRVPSAERAARLNALKPHVSLLEAATAVDEVDQILHKASGVRVATAG